MDTPSPTDASTPAPSQTPSSTPVPTEPAPTLARMPFLPVVNFWSTRDSISLDELRDEHAAGRVWVADADKAAVESVLGANGFIRSSPVDAAAVIAAVKAGAMGILRATDLHPSVRALAVDGVSLFGNDRVTDLADWPLVAEVETTEPWDQSATWTLVAVGDMMFDRLVINHLNEAGGDKQHLFDGGTSRVTRLRCCSFFGYQYPDVERTGNRGLVRDMLTSADLTIGNMESAVLYDAPHHADPRGFQFTTDASWMPVLADNGFDLLSMANNHARDAGVRGLNEGIQAITEAGMAAAGVGVGDAAAEPAYLEANGTSVAVIACDYIRSRRPPMEGRLAALSCQNGPVVDSIREARERADTVIVYPHWGVEYERPVAYQYELSRQWIDAGADMIIGHHSHFPGGIYEYDGRVSLLSLGNFIFDQNFRQTTLQGLVVETTWHGKEPVQIRAHPLLNVDAQPNFAEPEDAQWAFDVMRWQSPPSRLDWGGGPTPDFGNTPRK
jgi:poly-gamma-glutamate capsule biosynthesis protein CapA/YwtB (metallophosphatase superfamily)